MHVNVTGYAHGPHGERGEGDVFVCVNLPTPLFDAVDHPCVGENSPDLKVISIPGTNVNLFLDRKDV